MRSRGHDRDMTWMREDDAESDVTMLVQQRMFTWAEAYRKTLRDRIHQIKYANKIFIQVKEQLQPFSDFIHVGHDDPRQSRKY